MIGWFAQGGGAIVTTAAGTDHGGVIDPADTAEPVYVFTGLAGIGGIDMVRRLADLIRAVMAAVATAGNTAVIKDRTFPTVGGVAVITGVG